MKRLLIRILSRLGLLSLFNLNAPVQMNGKTFTVPVLQKFGLGNLYPTEKWMNGTLLQVSRLVGDGIILDVGVNIGQTLLKIQSIFPGKSYLGIEPNPICVFYVDNMIKANGWTNCKLIPAGLADTTDIAELHFFYDNKLDSTASIVKNFRPDQKVVRKEYIPLFPFRHIRKAASINRIALIKIDVEGAEYDVLKSLLPSLESDRPIILCEILPVYKASNTDRLTRQQGIEDILEKLNYSKYRIRKTRQDDFSHFEPVEKIGIVTQIELSDYIFVPAELNESFKKLNTTTQP